MADKKVVFAVPPQTQLLDLSGPAHIFYEAREAKKPIDIRFVTTTHQKDITSAAGLNFTSLEDYSKISLVEGDALFIPGINAQLLTDPNFWKAHRLFLEWLRDQYSKSVTICSVCTGAFILAESGILNRKIATTHWKFIELLAQRYPEITIAKNRLFIKDDLIYSSAGVSAGIDLALFILQEWWGNSFSLCIARENVIYLRRGGDDPQISPFLMHRNHMDDSIHMIQDWISENLDRRPNLNELSEIACTSPRNLTRRFRKSTGISIVQYANRLKRERAQQMIVQNHKVEAIALACGFKSAKRIRLLLKKS